LGTRGGRLVDLSAAGVFMVGCLQGL
jgi:hypothetical protein